MSVTPYYCPPTSLEYIYSFEDAYNSHNLIDNFVFNIRTAYDSIKGQQYSCHTCNVDFEINGQVYVYDSACLSNRTRLCLDCYNTKYTTLK